MTTQKFLLCIAALFGSVAITLILCAATLHFAHSYTDKALHPPSPHAIHKS